MCCENLFDLPSTPAPFRLLSIRAPASGGATDFFLASALCCPPSDLAIDRCRRRAMRPTDVCHPNDLRAPAPRVFPILSRWLPSGEAPRSLGLRTAACASGDRTFHDVQDRFGGSSPRANLPISTSRSGIGSVGVFFPRRACDRASDTPVAYRVHRLASPSFPGAAFLAARLSCGEVGAGRTMRVTPRPASTPPRERRRFRRSGMPSIGRDPSRDPVAVTAPVPRPPHHLSGDVATAGWHSRATLDLRPVLARSLG